MRWGWSLRDKGNTSGFVDFARGGAGGLYELRQPETTRPGFPVSDEPGTTNPTLLWSVLRALRSRLCGLYLGSWRDWCVQAQLCVIEVPTFLANSNRQKSSELMSWQKTSACRWCLGVPLSLVRGQITRQWKEKHQKNDHRIIKTWRFFRFFASLHGHFESVRMFDWVLS